MTQGHDPADRQLAAYLRDIAGEAAAEHDQGLGADLGRVIRERAAADTRRQARVIGLLAIGVLFASAAALRMPALSEFGGPSPSPVSEGDAFGLASAQPDSELSLEDATAWLIKARADISNQGLGNRVLVPILIHVSASEAYVWFRDYRSGEQALAQYEGAEPGVAKLVAVEWPSAKTAGPSEWELARISDAIASDVALQGKVGPPVVLLTTSVALCPSGVGVCARVRISGSKLHAPADGPALAPAALVDLQTLEVSLEIAPVMTPETKTLTPA